jgi:hypothetical protein
MKKLRPLLNLLRIIMKKLILSIILVLELGVFCLAQGTNYPTNVTVPYLKASDYNFSRTCGAGATITNCTLTAATPATVTLRPFPLGITTGNYIYISSGTGTAEAVAISSYNAISITFTPANNHSVAWKISSATAGIQEAIITSNTFTIHNRIKLEGKLYTIYVPVVIDQNGVEVEGSGVNTVVYQATSGNDAFRLGKANGGSTIRFRSRLADMTIVGGLVSGKAINAKEMHHGTYENLFLFAGTSSTGTGVGIYLETCYFTTIIHPIITANFPPVPSVTRGMPKYGIQLHNSCNDVWISDYDCDSSTACLYFTGTGHQGGYLRGAYLATSTYAILSDVGSSHSVSKWSFTDIECESNTNDFYAYNVRFCDIGPGAMRITMPSNSTNNFIHNVNYTVDNAFSDAGYFNTWDNCGQSGTTLPTISATSIWRNLTNIGTWPFSRVYSSKIDGTTASVADGGSITHGFGTTPTNVQASPSISGEFVSVTAIGATTFTVAIKKHDGTAGTTQTIYWTASK